MFFEQKKEIVFSLRTNDPKVAYPLARKKSVEWTTRFDDARNHLCEPDKDEKIQPLEIDKITAMKLANFYLKSMLENDEEIRMLGCIDIDTLNAEIETNLPQIESALAGGDISVAVNLVSNVLFLNSIDKELTFNEHRVLNYELIKAKKNLLLSKRARNVGEVVEVEDAVNLSNTLKSITDLAPPKIISIDTVFDDWKFSVIDRPQKTVKDVERIID